VTNGPSGPRRASGVERRRKLWERILLLGPGYAYILVLFVVPLALIVSLAFFRRGRFGGVIYEPTLANFERALEPVFVQVLIDSIVIAGVTTGLALLIGFPTAWVIAQLPGRWRVIALILVVLPFWTNFLIRTYAWILLLNNEGVINGALRGIGLIDAPLGLLYNDGAIVAGLLYAYLPLMILPVFAAIERLDPELREAAANLGATPTRVFRSVTLPLTLPGVLIGCIFVFVPSLGNFVVPELLGGGKTIMVGNLIRDQFLTARDWPFGAVLAIVLVTGLLAILVLQSTLSRRSEATSDA
jgi:spermidine/putrescine transport system permease protein